MPGFLKDDLTVALDDVDRTASRIITIYHDLAATAGDEQVADRLRREAQRREAAFARYIEARRSHGHVTEVDDPERSHLQALWLKLRAMFGAPGADQGLTAVLDELDETLRRTVATAADLQPPEDIRDALEQIAGERHAG
jgi:hypothetical protein